MNQASKVNFKKVTSIFKKFSFYFWKLNKITFIFFLIGWILICLVWLVPCMFIDNNTFGIKKTPFFNSASATYWYGTTKNGGSDQTDIFGLTWSLNYGIYGIIAFIYYSIFSIILINKNINTEIKTGVISNWLSTNIKKKELLLTKIINIYIMMFFIFVSSFIIYLITALDGTYRTIDINYFLLYSLGFFLFIIFFSTIYFFIYISFEDKILKPTSISSAIIAFLSIIFLLNVIYDNYKEHYKYLVLFKYINPLNLMINPCKIAKELEGPSFIREYKKGISTLQYHKYEYFPIWKYVLFPFVQLGTIILFNKLAAKRISRIDLNI